MSDTSLVMHNVVVGGLRTSVRLEPVMWEALQEIARCQGKTITQLVTEIDRMGLATSLTSAIRVYIVDFYRSSIGQAQPEAEPRLVPAGVVASSGAAPRHASAAASRD